MFKDKFVGGPLDGEIRDVSAETLEGANVTDQTGMVYERAPRLDSAEHRVWLLTTDQPQDMPQEAPADAPAGGPLQVIMENRHGLTLGELARFVDGARRNGWSDDDQVNAVSGWTLKLRKLTMRT